MPKPNEVVELSVLLNFGDTIVLHTDSSSAHRFHKRMESFLAGRVNRTDNFKMHTIGGTVILSEYVVSYSAVTTAGDPVVFLRTPAS